MPLLVLEICGQIYDVKAHLQYGKNRTNLVGFKGHKKNF
jgi:hypothetical protein